MNSKDLIRLTPNDNNKNESSDEIRESINNHRKNTRITSVDKSQKRIITKIQSQKAKGRYNIYLDDEYAFAVDESLLIKHLLNKGTHITEEFQKQLEAEDNFSKAYTRALNYLSYSLRTEKQIRDDLTDKEYEEYADEVLNRLKEQKLINDLEYAKSYIRTASSINRKGPRLIANELKSKGIADLLIEDAMVEYPYELQLENASVLISKRMKKVNKSSEREKLNKLNAYLYGKGFSNDVISEAFEQVNPEVDEDEEYDALIKQGDKAWRRYSRKATDYELIQKVKSFLYSKGYPTDLINKYIDMKSEDEY